MVITLSIILYIDHRLAKKLFAINMIQFIYELIHPIFFSIDVKSTIFS